MDDFFCEQHLDNDTKFYFTFRSKKTGEVQMFIFHKGFYLRAFADVLTDKAVRGEIELKDCQTFVSRIMPVMYECDCVHLSEEDINDLE